MTTDTGFPDLPEPGKRMLHVPRWHAQVFPESDPAMGEYPLAVARAYLHESEEGRADG